MSPDIQKYRRYLEGFDMTEERKAELIRMVWTIMESFADQAFGLHPVQLCRSEATDDDSNSGGNDVHFDRPFKIEFQKVTGPSGDGDEQP